jgi:hypothetical protein
LSPVRPSVWDVEKCTGAEPARPGANRIGDNLYKAPIRLCDLKTRRAHGRAAERSTVQIFNRPRSFQFCVPGSQSVANANFDGQMFSQFAAKPFPCPGGALFRGQPRDEPLSKNGHNGFVIFAFARFAFQEFGDTFASFVVRVAQRVL